MTVGSLQHKMSISPNQVVITRHYLTRINAHSHVGPSRKDDLTEKKNTSDAV
jgi:hypothetical protein